MVRYRRLQLGGETEDYERAKGDFMIPANIFVTIWDFLKNAGTTLAPFQVLIGLLAMVFAGYASLRLWKQNKQLKEVARAATPKTENLQDTIRFYEGVQTSNPVTLAMSLVPQTPSIKEDVEKFLDIMRLKMDIEELNMSGIISSDDVERFINLLREKRYLFDLQGRTEVHLFVQGPVVAGILIGAIFDNWKPVKLHHKPTPGIPAIYQYWCPLTK